MGCYNGGCRRDPFDDFDHDHHHMRHEREEFFEPFPFDHRREREEFFEPFPFDHRREREFREFPRRRVIIVGPRRPF